MLVLPRAVYQQMIDHLQACYPTEGCGFLAGRESRARLVYPVSNLLRSPTAYQMEPAEQLAALLAIEERHEELLAIYHSHPQGPQRPSASDMAQWYYPAAALIIVSLADRERPSAAAYRWDQGRMVNYPLTVTPQSIV